jgi:ATP-binding cassette subfamily B protein
LYDPDSGSITIDGVNIRDFHTEDLRKEVGVIFQDYAKYQASARENIWFGNAALSPYDPEIETAGKLAGADSAIERLPDGYDSMLGRMFENGVELSIGEWQKIALARAILRNSQILVLDEPTSSLDVVTETHFFNRIREIARGKTVFLISHRLSTVRIADRIAFLKNGKLDEYGTHEELMKKQGNYARLFTMQSRFYTNEKGKQ